MKPYKIVITEDYKLLSEAIAGVVNQFKNFEVIYTCENGKDLIDKISTWQKPDIILMDINMPVINGIEATKWVYENHPDILVMALSVEDDEKTIIEMIRAGAKGYLLKDVDKKTLESALENLIENGIYHSKMVNNALVHSLNNDEFHLKDTEKTFLNLICTELTYREIAEKMHLSPKTIDGYRDQLFIKLNVKNRIGLVLYAIKNKIYEI